MRRSHVRWLLLIGLGVAFSLQALAQAQAQAQVTAHGDPIAPVILGVTGILFFAIVGRFAARHLNQPSVLGEVLVGMVIGTFGSAFGFELMIVLREGPAVFDIINLALTGEPLERAAEQILGSDAATRVVTVLQGPNGGVYMGVAHTVDVFSRYGVIFLLFLVGLQISVEEMRTVGFDASRVAVLGVMLPFILGFGAMRLLAPGVSPSTDMFVAATLGATSVGITAEVLRELGRERSREGHIILGAAVIDDILGLVTLAVVSGIVVSGGVVMANVVFVVVLAIAFLVGAIYLGPYVLRVMVKMLRRLDIVEAKMFTSFMFVMVLAWLANLMGLATIVGAFTAGVILHEGYFESLSAEGEHLSIRELIMPLEVILVPIFFILMGIQVKLETFLDVTVIVTAIGLLAAAMAGKIISGWGAGSRANRLLVGLGMMPRGEVGLIFASIGKSLGVITDSLFSAIVLTVIVTTLAAPPMIKFATRFDTRPRAG